MMVITIGTRGIVTMFVRRDGHTQLFIPSFVMVMWCGCE